MNKVRDNWARMSRGYKTPKMKVRFPDGEVFDYDESYQCYRGMRYKGKRPVEITILSDIDKETYYKYILPLVSPYGDGVSLGNGVEIYD